MWLLIVMPFFFSTLYELLPFPRVIRYVLDAAWLLLVYFLLRGRSPLKRNRGFQLIGLWTLAFLIYTVLVYLVQFQSPLYYLWGFRNNFRLYAAFFAFGAMLDREDVEGYFRLFDTLFWLNAVVSLFQYFVLDLSGDQLGGLFGVEKGSNGWTNIFFSIMVAKSAMFYLEKRERVWVSGLKCVTALALAALAELKFFFVEFVLIIVLASMFSNFTWRKFWILIGGILAVTVGAALLVSVFPNFTDFLSLEWFYENALSNKGYTSSGDLNRLNAIPRINEMWLTNLPERLFGLGLGNCDTSTFSIVNTPFFQAYEDYHYTWLSYAIIYLEMGYIGLVLYFGFFVMVYYQIRRIEKRSEGVIGTYCRIARIMALMCMIFSVYNSSMRAESAYMVHFVIAIPFACLRESGKAPLRTAG